MNVRPKRHLDGGVKMLYGDMLAIECEVYSPPSSEGRTVYVFLDDDDVTMLLRECRDAASRHRTDPEHKTVRWATMGMPTKADDLGTWFSDLLRGGAW
jgi:hypothetical protein